MDGGGIGELFTKDSKKNIQRLSSLIKQGNNETAVELLTLIERSDRCKKSLLAHRENDDETILHVAAKSHKKNDMVIRLAKLCPHLLTKWRKYSKNEYNGQTAFHIAITKGNNDAVAAMLFSAKQNAEIKAPDVLTKMMYTEAIGKRFVNTVMMGGIPLSVAALTFNSSIVQTLIDNGAKMESVNNHGDTVFHSLVRYAAIDSKNVPDVVEMLQYLHNNGKTDLVRSNTVHYNHTYAYIWLAKNNMHLTPLQLAAKYGVVDVFDYIINLKGVYCFLNTHDGLFDIKMYDVTEVDSIANVRAAAAKTHSRGSVIPTREGIAEMKLTYSQKVCLPCVAEYPKSNCILEMMFKDSYKSKDAFRLIDMVPVKNLLRAKWTYYLKIYYSWAAFHMLFMVALTAYAVIRPSVVYNTSGTSRVMRENANPQVSLFIAVFKWFPLIIGLIYGLVSILLFVQKFRRPNAHAYISHNIEYTLLLSTFSICIVIDTLMTISDDSHNSIPLIIGLVTGWWFNIFFLCALRVFSFFTELIKRVIVGDLFRFGIVMLFELISFTASMHILLQTDAPGTSGGTYNVSTTVGSVTMEQLKYSTYWNTMLAMFTLMLGLGDFETITDTRVPWLSVTLFVIFVSITYILLLNSLIAMMSRTCALVLENRDPRWRIQQLSVILFLEDIFCLWYLRRLVSPGIKEKTIRGYDDVSKQYKSDQRFLLEIHSLEKQYATEDEEDTTGLRETKDRMVSDINRGTMLLDDTNVDLSLSTRRTKQRSKGKGKRQPTSRQFSREVPAITTGDYSPGLTRKPKRSKQKRHQSENIHEQSLQSPTSVGQHSGFPANLSASAPASVPTVGNGHAMDIQTVHVGDVSDK